MRLRRSGTLTESLAEVAVICTAAVGLGFGAPAPAVGQTERPTVAILVYEGVQIIDFAIPFEVFGQFGRHEVFTVARDSTPVSTYMGMRLIPNHILGEHPDVDVLVLPGGAGTSEAAANPALRSWIDRTVGEAKHVLATCTGVFLLVDGGHLAGRRVTTWYGRQDDLQAAVPDAEIDEEEIVMEDGKFVTSSGTGLEATLRVVSLIHGEAWAELIRLNMEYEPIPEQHHVPRIHLADLRLPESIYAHFPWREADFLRYEGNRDSWEMAWRFRSDLPLGTLASRLTTDLVGEDRWREIREESRSDTWIVTGRLPGSRSGETAGERSGGGEAGPKPGAGNRAPTWFGRMELTRAAEDVYELAFRVRREEFTGTDPVDGKSR